MEPDPEGHVFASLLRHVAPLVMAPPGPIPPTAPQLRGVVRSSNSMALVSFCYGGDFLSGNAFEFDLFHEGQPLAVDSAVEWVRSTVHNPVTNSRTNLPARSDSHGNRIMSASALGFSYRAGPSWYDQNLFGMLSIFIHGGGFPWFEDVYVCSGFMVIDAAVCRIYINPSSSDMDTFGIDIPLFNAEGTVNAGMGGSLPQELASLVESGTIRNQPRLLVEDNYCSAVFDMRRWVVPGTPT